METKQYIYKFARMNNGILNYRFKYSASKGKGNDGFIFLTEEELINTKDLFWVKRGVVVKNGKTMLSHINKKENK